MHQILPKFYICEWDWQPNQNDLESPIGRHENKNQYGIVNGHNRPSCHLRRREGGGRDHACLRRRISGFRHGRDGLCTSEKESRSAGIEGTGVSVTANKGFAQNGVREPGVREDKVRKTPASFYPQCFTFASQLLLFCCVVFLTFPINTLYLMR